MDMSEVTREELDARIESVESRIDRRFAEADAKAEVRFAATDARFAEAEAKNEARFAQAEARAEKRITELIKWMVGTGLAAAAVGGGVMGLVFSSMSSKHAAPIVITVPTPVQGAPAG
jgi:ribulose 1,5-bisphosphate synthetase/thiazole synthase